jgi:hypothetical protein
MAVGTGVAEPGQAPTVDVFLNVQAPGAAAVALPQVLEGVGVRVWQTDQIRAWSSPPVPVNSLGSRRGTPAGLGFGR